MRIEADRDFIEIAEVERISQGSRAKSDIRLAVRASFGDFSGLYDGIWIEQPMLRDFVQALERLEQLEECEATLESMSPQEFILKIRPKDSLGHLVVEAMVARDRYSGSSRIRTSVSGGMEIALGELTEVVRSFRSLLG